MTIKFNATQMKDRTDTNREALVRRYYDELTLEVNTALERVQKGRTRAILALRDGDAIFESALQNVIAELNESKFNVKLEPKIKADLREPMSCDSPRRLIISW